MFNPSIGSHYARQLRRNTGGDVNYDAAATRSLHAQIAEARRAGEDDIADDWQRAIAFRAALNA